MGILRRSPRGSLVSLFEWGGVGLAIVALVATPHAVELGDGATRFDSLSKLLEHGTLSPERYSLVGPLAATPLWLLGKLWRSPGWWCGYANLVLLLVGLLVLHRVLKTLTDPDVARRFTLLVTCASMFPYYQREFGGEVFTAVLLGVGLAALTRGRRGWGSAALILAVANTPAAAVGVCLVLLVIAWPDREWRYAGVAVGFALVILAENWLRRGDPLNGGYIGDVGFATVMPYSGQPGFSYPFVLGVVSLLFAFGKGILWFAPGLVLAAEKHWRGVPSRATQLLRWWLIVGVGLIVGYAKWWSWYGGFAWGPRFLLFLGLPASLALACSLTHPPAGRGGQILTLAITTLAFWVGASGLVYGQSNLEICTENQYALEALCWYAPEFSPLVRPFIVAPERSLLDAAVLLLWGLIYAGLVVPRLRAVLIGLPLFPERPREPSGDGVSRRARRFPDRAMLASVATIAGLLFLVGWNTRAHSQIQRRAAPAAETPTRPPATISVPDPQRLRRPDRGAALAMGNRFLSGGELFSVSVEAPEPGWYRVTIEASGTRCEEPGALGTAWPTVTLRTDGAIAGEITVDSANSQAVSWPPLYLERPVTKLSLFYSNDFADPKVGCDRNLVVTQVEIVPLYRESSTDGRSAEDTLPFRDPNLPFPARVEDLIGRLTPDEKVSLLVHDSPEIERLGIPPYNWMNEGIHGVAFAGRATVFPMPIGLASSWDQDLVRRVATAISDEARAIHHRARRRGETPTFHGLTFWSPTINILRDPRWGRAMETYGEDPHLTARLAVAYVRGMQGDHPHYLKTVATPKHFAVHSGPESRRHHLDVAVNDRDLRQTYLPAFRAAVVEGGAYSLMCAYNRVRGEPSCGSRWLLNDTLREAWGFRGYVVSDCGAIQDMHDTDPTGSSLAEAAARALRAGCDLSCGHEYASLRTALARGWVTEAEIDRALSRLLLARFELGELDPPEGNPDSRIPYEVVDSEPHRRLALEAARKSIVLLKNDGILPLSKDLPAIAVVGPNAADAEVLLGEYHGTPTDPITVLRGIREAVAPQVRVLHAPGSGWTASVAPLVPVPREALRSSAGADAISGLTGEYFANPDCAGEPVVTRIDATIAFDWWEGSPDPRLPPDGFCARWTGELVAPATGDYVLGARAFNGFRLALGGAVLAQLESQFGPARSTGNVRLESGKRYPLRLELSHRSHHAHLHLQWRPPSPGALERAVAAARAAEVVVAVVGLTPQLEGEERPVVIEGFNRGDRDRLSLPPAQEELIGAMLETGKPVVLVLLNGSVVSTSWADRAAAIVEAWYPGQAGGRAVAEVLFGDVNPSGRLPVTFVRSEEELPPFDDYAMSGRTYRYFRGEPAFPFGHGLSYTHFAYSDLILPASVNPSTPWSVSVTVQNVGERDGEEVVQVFLTDPQADASSARQSLVAFSRVHLTPGEIRTMRLTVQPEQLAWVREDAGFEARPRLLEVSVGRPRPRAGGTVRPSDVSSVSGRVELRP